MDNTPRTPAVRGLGSGPGDPARAHPKTENKYSPRFGDMHEAARAINPRRLTRGRSSKLRKIRGLPTAEQGAGGARLRPTRFTGTPLQQNRQRHPPPAAVRVTSRFPARGVGQNGTSPDQTQKQ